MQLRHCATGRRLWSRAAPTTPATATKTHATTCAPRPACWKGFPVPRVYTQKKSSRGAERRCGRYGCGKVIEPGESYFQFSFRYGGTHYRCAEHRPRQSELTQSKMSAVYAAIEDAGDNL